jgi:5-methylcytosine-specific restriction enzyme A
MIRRSESLATVALFLSRCCTRAADQPGRPPEVLGVSSWNHAYALFYDALGDGRPLKTFRKTLAASRDRFDSWVSDSRRGWRDVDGAPSALPRVDALVYSEWLERTDEDLWTTVRPFANFDLQCATPALLASLRPDPVATDTMTDDADFIGFEGQRIQSVTSRIERDRRARAVVLASRGFACEVCGFDFATAYGPMGEAFAEVHHLSQLADSPEEGRPVNPATDLAVLCANCHRMVHRYSGQVLTLDEVRAAIAGALQLGSIR